MFDFNKNSMEHRLLQFIKSTNIIDLGWFKSCSFEKYLNTINEREEYHIFDYKPLTNFLNAGQKNNSFNTIIVVLVDYFFENKYNSGYKLSNYSRFCWSTTNHEANKIITFLKERNYKAEFINTPARVAASVAGLGFFGKNCMFYSTKIGSYVGIQTIGTDLKLKYNKAVNIEYNSNSICNNCNKCIESCPTNAIYKDGYRINPLKCISFLNRHSEETHFKLSKTIKLNGWLHGCEICQDICPINGKYKNKHKKAIKYNEKLNIYGLEIKNKSSISKAEIANKFTQVNNDGYRKYLTRLLNE